VPVEQKQASTDTKSGLVISTSPDNGNSISEGGTVTVFVSTGAANITLPNLQGTQSAAAQSQLKNAGFTNVQPVPDAQSTLPSGEVDHMSPAPGSYPADQQITLYVSGGGTQVPNVVNQTQGEAVAILQQDGFTVNVNSIPAASDQMVEPGTVYNQNPGANSVEPKGTQIQIFVQPQVTVSPTPSSTPTDTTPPTTTPTDTPTTTPTDTTTSGGGPGGGGPGGGGISTQAATSGP
jgi:beta-lactam-binding protein with PASTA domain